MGILFIYFNSIPNYKLCSGNGVEFFMNDFYQSKGIIHQATCIEFFIKCYSLHLSFRPNYLLSIGPILCNKNRDKNMLTSMLALNLNLH